MKFLIAKHSFNLLIITKAKIDIINTVITTFKTAKKLTNIN